ncbi:MAG: hypothetical protein VX663_11360 [Pseudomonadota bacterium]|nr:hypothetical protein [Pseudomonadota bacterium]
MQQPNLPVSLLAGKFGGSVLVTLNLATYAVVTMTMERRSPG